MLLTSARLAARPASESLERVSFVRLESRHLASIPVGNTWASLPTVYSRSTPPDESGEFVMLLVAEVGADGDISSPPIAVSKLAAIQVSCRRGCASSCRPMCLQLGKSAGARTQPKHHVDHADDRGGRGDRSNQATVTLCENEDGDGNGGEDDPADIDEHSGPQPSVERRSPDPRDRSRCTLVDSEFTTWAANHRNGNRHEGIVSERSGR